MWTTFVAGHFPFSAQTRKNSWSWRSLCSFVSSSGESLFPSLPRMTQKSGRVGQFEWDSYLDSISVSGRESGTGTGYGALIAHCSSSLSSLSVSFCWVGEIHPKKGPMTQHSHRNKDLPGSRRRECIFHLKLWISAGFFRVDRLVLGVVRPSLLRHFSLCPPFILLSYCFPFRSCAASDDTKSLENAREFSQMRLICVLYLYLVFWSWQWPWTSGMQIDLFKEKSYTYICNLYKILSMSLVSGRKFRQPLSKQIFFISFEMLLTPEFTLLP